MLPENYQSSMNLVNWQVTKLIDKKKSIVIFNIPRLKARFAGEPEESENSFKIHPYS